MSPADSRPPADPASADSAPADPAPMLAELLALHESMIAQLQMECLERNGAGDFLPRMIAQHERAAAMLVAQLRFHQAGVPPEPAPAAT